MPAKATLRYLPAAQEDLVSILEFISKDSPGRAVSFVDRLDERIGRLEHHPLLGRMPRHPKLREYGYRVLVIESYLVFYIIRGQPSRYIGSFTALAISTSSSDFSDSSFHGRRISHGKLEKKRSHFHGGVVIRIVTDKKLDISPV